MKKFVLALMALSILLVGCQAEQVSHEKANQEIEAASQALVGGLQINEIKLSGSKFVEIFNGGSSSTSLSGLKVATGRSDTGVNLSSACALSGSLGAGAYLTQNNTQCPGLSWADPDGAGPVTLNFYLLNSSNAVIETVVFPNPDGSPVQSCTCRYWFGQYVCSEIYPSIGMTWAALPNGGDCFGVGSPTPGASN